MTEDGLHHIVLMCVGNGNSSELYEMKNWLASLSYATIILVQRGWSVCLSVCLSVRICFHYWKTRA